MTYNIKIEYINTAKEPKITADKRLIRRVFANMFNNGINYSYKNTNLIINLYESDNKIYIKIKNTGYEIPEEIKEHIFDKYVSSGQLNHKTGAGLGLYYCKKAVEAHNGNISLIAENNCNEFVIEFPKIPKDNSNEPFSFV
jgi:signal transduction histidine kinase